MAPLSLRSLESALGEIEVGRSVCWVQPVVKAVSMLGEYYGLNEQVWKAAVIGG